MGDARKMARIVHVAFLGRIPDQPLEKAKLTLTRHSSRQPDFDGMVHSFKRIIDALVKCGILIDDNPDVIGSPTYKWAKAARGDGHIQVEVESV